MITLYHGTNFKGGKSIIKDKSIKNKIARRFDADSGNPTTDGYVYLTDSIGFATYHGNTGNINLGIKETCIFIFRITLDQKLLSADTDEYKFQNDIIIDESNIHEYDFKRSLNDIATCRANTSLTTENSTIEYVVIDDRLLETIGTSLWSSFIGKSLAIDENKHHYNDLILKYLKFKNI